MTRFNKWDKESDIAEANKRHVSELIAKGAVQPSDDLGVIKRHILKDKVIMSLVKAKRASIVDIEGKLFLAYRKSRSTYGCQCQLKRKAKQLGVFDFEERVGDKEATHCTGCERINGRVITYRGWWKEAFTYVSIWETGLKENAIPVSAAYPEYPVIEGVKDVTETYIDEINRSPLPKSPITGAKCSRSKKEEEQALRGMAALRKCGFL